MAYLEIAARHLGLIEAACESCGLIFLKDETETNRSPLSLASLPACLRKEASSRKPPRCDHVIQIAPDNLETFSKFPYLIRVYERQDSLILVWEDHEDGFGLAAFFGQFGERFLVFLALEIVHTSFVSMRKLRTEVDCEENIHITFCEPNDMNKTITVRISPTGDVTLKTQGYEGAECQKATEAAQAALGMVVEDHATEEMYKHREQTQSVQVHEG